MMANKTKIEFVVGSKANENVKLESNCKVKLPAGVSEHSALYDFIVSCD